MMADGTVNGKGGTLPLSPGSPTTEKRDRINQQPTAAVGAVEIVENLPHVPPQPVFAANSVVESLWKVCGKFSLPSGLFPAFFKAACPFSTDFPQVSPHSLPHFPQTFHDETRAIFEQ